MDERQRAFQEFEHRGWQEVAARYAELAGAATSQATEPLLDAAGVSAGDRVLDVATGPGFVAAAAHRRGARTVGVDLSEAMLAQAAKLHPGPSFRQGAAESLPCADGEFDAVVSAFGMPHFADHAAFFAESRRVLRTGGALAFATWHSPDRNPFFALVMGAIAREGSLEVSGLPEGPDFMAYADPARCQEELTAAGFQGVETGTCPIEFVSRGGVSSLLGMIENSTVRTRALFQAQTPQARERIAHALGEMLTPYAEGGGLRVPGAAIVVAARRV